MANIPGEIELLSRTLKVLGDSNRLGIVMSLGKETRSVTEIITATGLSQTLVSFHLRALRDAGIVLTKRNGPFIYYRLATPALLDILSKLAVLISTGEDSRPTTSAFADKRGDGATGR